MEAEFESGSRNRVLRNLLGIVRVRSMEDAESEQLERIQREAAARIPLLMQEFERDALFRRTPCNADDPAEVPRH